MRILIVGESTTVPSGFGQQTKMLAEGFAEAGHEVVILAAGAKRLTDLHERIQEWPIANITNTEVVDRTIDRLKPDVALVFWFTHMVSYMTRLRSLPVNCHTFFWLPWEGSTPPQGANTAFPNVQENKVIHLSEFARKLWEPYIKSNIVIPHCVDLEVFKPREYSQSQKAMLRRKWAERLQFPIFEDSLLLLNVDRNIKHKRWDATLDLVRRLQKRTSDRVQLIAHTIKNSIGQFHGNITGYDIPKMCKVYEVEEQVAFTDFAWDRGFTREDLVELMSIVDFRISTSAGEGFGIPTIECAVARCPQVVNDHTTMPELLGDSLFRVPPAFAEFDREALWQTPNVGAMVDRIIELHEDAELRDVEVDKAESHAQQFSKDKVVARFLDVFKQGLSTDGLWYNHRFGLIGDIHTRLGFKDIAVTISKIDARAVVLEVGSFEGKFIDIAIEVGLNVSGIEPDVNASRRASNRAKVYIEEKEFTDTWPACDVVVLTDVWPLILERGGQEALNNVVDRVSKVEWLITRNDLVYKWDLPKVDENWIVSQLVEKGLHRRADMEKIVRSKWGGNFSHQIWHRGEDTSYMPKGFVEVM